VIVQGAAFVLTLLLVRIFPGFPFPAALALLGVVLVALSFGAGPSLLATGIAAILVDGVVVPADSTWPLLSFPNAVAIALLVGTGAVASVVASRSARARRVAEDAIRDRDTFLALAAHELKTPLMVIQGSAQLLTRRFSRQATAATSAEALIGETRPVVARIEAGTERMGRLIEEMMTLAAIEAGRLVLHLAPCPLLPILQAAVRDQRQVESERRIVLRAPAVPIIVEADADRIRQVVIEYLSNAVKYAPVDRPIRLLAEVLGDRARVSVHDEGFGLPPALQDQVWAAFYQAPGVEVQTGSRVGLGLGLHICRTIVERHGGQTGVESAVGQGATFWFTLPLAPPEAGTPPPEAGTPPPEGG
jgi:signal transduction histidine kinase